MKEKVFFLNMFPDYTPPEELKEALSQAAIAAADIDPVQQRVHIAIHTDSYIPRRLLSQVEVELRQCYGLRGMELIATHPAHQLHQIEPTELRDLFVEQISMARAALAGAQWNWDGQTLRVKLLGNGVEQLQEAALAVERQLRERFETPVHIVFEAGETLDGQQLFAAMEKLRGTMLDAIPKNAASEKKAQPSQPEHNAFYGKPIKGQVTPMQDVTLDMGSVIIEGRVFAVEHKELKKRNAWVINFDMTDNYGSVRINRFMEANEAKPILENVKVGAVLKVQGKPELNRYDNEMVLKPFAMQPGAMPKRKDTYPGQKRVELHLHTSMSR